MCFELLAIHFGDDAPQRGGFGFPFTKKHFRTKNVIQI
jgi:hypothetical protein